MKRSLLKISLLCSCVAFNAYAQTPLTNQTAVEQSTNSTTTQNATPIAPNLPTDMPAVANPQMPPATLDVVPAIPEIPASSQVMSSPDIPAEPVVAPVPKPTARALEMMVDHMNNKEVDHIINMFSDEGFSYVNIAGEVFYNKDSLRKYLLSSLSNKTYTISVNNIRELSPQVALIDAHVNVYNKEDKVPHIKTFLLATMKYEKSAWQIVSLQHTAELTNPVNAEATAEKGKALLYGMLIGGALGLIIPRVFAPFRAKKPTGV